MEVENCARRFIPVDVVYQIFLKLPAKSLLRLRCVSKFWCNIIDSVSFAIRNISIRATAAADEPQILALPSLMVPPSTLRSIIYEGEAIKGSGYPILEFSLLEGVDHLDFHIDSGLLCFQNNRGETFLCNPLRGEVLELPPLVNPGKYHPQYGMGFDSKTNTYKIVRIPLSLEKIHDVFWGFLQGVETEIYTLGTSSWRRISSVPSFLFDGDGVSANGDMHWLNWNYASSDHMITSFDFKNEEFKVTPFPDFATCKTYEKFRLGNVSESLAIMKFSYAPSETDHIEVWLLKDYEKKEWVREYKISTHAFKEIYAHNWRENIYFLDLKTNSICHMRRPGGKRPKEMIFGFTGTVLSLKNFGNSFAVAEDQRVSFLKTVRLVYIPIDKR